MAINLIGLAEQGYLPDWLIRAGIRALLGKRLKKEKTRIASSDESEMVRMLQRSPVALATDEANEQHYEVPAAFFETVLGPRLKYSCCLYADPNTTLGEAEEAMLKLCCERAELKDGMKILDLGCGWGSLSLWVAEHYPQCQVTALSNSKGQRRFIESRAAALGLKNLRVITANMAEYSGNDETYDRVISVEMFEHMRNYETLLKRIAGWLRPGGKLFVHIFCHREMTYTFETASKTDWMAQHFFRDGIMPSFDLLGFFDRDLRVSQRWQVNGNHYARTSEGWLKNLDANREKIAWLFNESTGPDEALLMIQRWRIFFMSCAELFRYRDGNEWFVGHYLFEPADGDAKRNSVESSEPVEFKSLLQNGGA